MTPIPLLLSAGEASGDMYAARLATALQQRANIKLFGMGGPPYVVYIAGRIPDPAAQRATISQMVILNVGLRVVAFGLQKTPAHHGCER